MRLSLIDSTRLGGGRALPDQPIGCILRTGGQAGGRAVVHPSVARGRAVGGGRLHLQPRRLALRLLYFAARVCAGSLSHARERLRRAGGGFLASGSAPKRDPTRRGAGRSSTAAARHTDARGSGVEGDGVRVGEGCTTKATEPVGGRSPLEAGDTAGDDNGGKAGGRGKLASSAGGASL